MGNSVFDGRASVRNRSDVITKFYTSAAWVEGRAEDQLNHVAGWDGVLQIAAFPDLHPGKYGPVGCAVLADRVYPQLIGNDIGCGMALFQLDLPVRKFRMDKALRRIRMLGDPMSECQAHRLKAAGLPYDRFATSLGTIGGGNHFCELQSLVDGDAYDKSRLYLLVHSGSRGLGTSVLNSLPEGAFKGLGAEDAQTYIAAHDSAVSWAKLNRQMIAERAADALRADLRLIVDAPHNMLAAYQGGWLHRKGAAAADQDVVPLAGSRASESFLLKPHNTSAALSSTAHGAGRRYDRSSMHGRIRSKRSDLEAMTRTAFGGRVLCEDKALLIEEAPLAYKSSQSVVSDLAATGTATAIAKFHPLLTFKKSKGVA